MESYFPLPRSQQPATCPCPEPDESSSKPPTVFNIHLMLPRPGHRFSKWFLFLSFSHQNPVRMSSSAHAQQMSLIPPFPPPWLSPLKCKHFQQHNPLKFLQCISTFSPKLRLRHNTFYLLLSPLPQTQFEQIDGFFIKPSMNNLLLGVALTYIFLIPNCKY